MTNTTLKDGRGRAFRQPIYIKFFRNELIVRLCRLDDASQIAGMGPHFYVDLPSSIRTTPFDAKLAMYEGNGNLGTIHMSWGAAGRDGTDSHEISKVLAKSWIEHQAYHLDIVLEVGAWLPETSSSGSPQLKMGQTYQLETEVPFERLLTFADFDTAEFSQKLYADKIKSNFGFEVPGYESMKYA